MDVMGVGVAEKGVGSMDERQGCLIPGGIVPKAHNSFRGPQNIL